MFADKRRVVSVKYENFFIFHTILLLCINILKFSKQFPYYIFFFKLIIETYSNLFATHIVCNSVLSVYVYANIIDCYYVLFFYLIEASLFSSTYIHTSASTSHIYFQYRYKMNSIWFMKKLCIYIYYMGIKKLVWICCTINCKQIKRKNQHLITLFQCEKSK